MAREIARAADLIMVAMARRVDFKSKINIPQTVNEVITNCPSDVEQLGFYTAIDPLKPKVNYLVFISQKIGQEMKVFKTLARNPPL